MFCHLAVFDSLLATATLAVTSDLICFHIHCSFTVYNCTIAVVGVSIS
jgi:hypothetical protein